jgi:hypothetical protein
MKIWFFLLAFSMAGRSAQSALAVSTLNIDNRIASMRESLANCERILSHSRTVWAGEVRFRLASFFPDLSSMNLGQIITHLIPRLKPNPDAGFALDVSILIESWVSARAASLGANEMQKLIRMIRAVGAPEFVPYVVYAYLDKYPRKLPIKDLLALTSDRAALMKWLKRGRHSYSVAEMHSIANVIGREPTNWALALRDFRAGLPPEAH